MAIIKTIEIELEAVGGGSWYTRMLFVPEGMGEELRHHPQQEVRTKKEALVFLWDTRKLTPNWQAPGIGQFSKTRSLKVALQVLFA